jgi:hypothetical protein
LAQQLFELPHNGLVNRVTPLVFGRLAGGTACLPPAFLNTAFDADS